MKRFSGLPSWVQSRVWPKNTFDLGGEEHQPSGGTFVGLGGSSFYNESKQSFSNAEIFKSSESGYILRARSFIVDTVVQIQACAAQGKIPKDWFLTRLGSSLGLLRKPVYNQNMFL
jgi:hypothetical protein